MKNRIITISREFGSGGRTIGKTVATELGIPCYDRELLQQIAAESGFDENYIKDAGEYAPGGFLFPRFASLRRTQQRGLSLGDPIQDHHRAGTKRSLRHHRAAVRIIFCAIKRICCAFLSMPI